MSNSSATSPAMCLTATEMTGSDLSPSSHAQRSMVGLYGSSTTTGHLTRSGPRDVTSSVAATPQRVCYACRVALVLALILREWLEARPRRVRRSLIVIGLAGYTLVYTII